MDRKVALLQENPNLRLRIEGHTDERGPRTENQAFGLRLAISAKNYIVSKGIAADRIDTFSFGDLRPLDFGIGEDNWALNRRAEFIPLTDSATIRLPRGAGSSGVSFVEVIGIPDKLFVVPFRSGPIDSDGSEIARYEVKLGMGNATYLFLTPVWYDIVMIRADKKMTIDLRMEPGFMYRVEADISLENEAVVTRCRSLDSCS